MQKPTINQEIYNDADGIRLIIVYDVKGYINYFSKEIKAQEFYKKELAKWGAEQEPTILFESETVKVMKFTREQFNKWYNGKENSSSRSHEDYDYSQPILIDKNYGIWYARFNITTDLIKAVQSMNVAKVGDHSVTRCECGTTVFSDNKFCKNCGKTLIKEAE